MPTRQDNSSHDANEDTLPLTGLAGAPMSHAQAIQASAAKAVPVPSQAPPRRIRGGPRASPVSSVAPSGFAMGPVQWDRNQTLVICLTGMITTGIFFGLMVPPPAIDPYPYSVISSMVGWFYFAAWTFSFLPQIYLNWRRQSVVGQSFEFVYLNVMGYGAYFVYNTCLFSVDAVREEYSSIFHNENNVAFNDISYAFFALTFCLWNAWQIHVYDRGDQTAMRPVVWLCRIVPTFFLGWGIYIVMMNIRHGYSGPLGFLYALSMVKFFVTLVKYIPQVLLNRSRRLTIGWNIWNVLLDFSGGFLSTAQEIFDAAVTGYWNGLIGNPVKLGLGLLSMTYNVIFMVQHFYLYKKNNRAVIQAIRLELAGIREDATQASPSVTPTSKFADGGANWRRAAEAMDVGDDPMGQRADGEEMGMVSGVPVAREDLIDVFDDDEGDFLVPHPLVKSGSKP